MADARLAKVQESLLALEKTRDLASAKKVVRDVSALLVPSLSEGADSLFRLFNDQDGKLKANAGWFFSDSTITDKLATYTLETPAENNLDIKVFGVKKAKKGTISWAVGLTPNFEDEPFNGKFNVGIDFIIPESLDRVIVALSKNYVIRTLELKGQLTATFQEILNSWLSVKDLSRKVEFHEILWNSLDLSPINKKFYEGISQRFISLRQHIETSGALDQEHAAQFANRLIGRVIFTWFLDKKALIEPSLKYFESEAFQDDTDYYREKLESLFFEVLNTPVSDRSAADTSTPYLNGGLFEPKPGDLYKDKTLTFPKNFFDDFLGFLRAYNFTTDESTTEFQQVAIDPEMLGRIFENLLAEVNEVTGEQARKAKGAFYTPRQIVDYMCKEALKSYLSSKLSKHEKIDHRLYQLIEASEREFQDQDHNWRRDFKDVKSDIIEVLDSIRVIDPACGSGAFPIGMMQLLVKVYSRLEPRFDSSKAKLSIIEKNIYGVDIEPMAVEITRLRAWLALIVDQEGAAAVIKPLPNLDFKFVAANSLVPLVSLGQATLFEDNDLDTKLKALREKFFRTQSPDEKSKLKDKYSQLINSEISLFEDSTRTKQLKSYRPFESDSVADFFDSMQMFGFEDGFDIVVGNPPYLDYRKVDGRTKFALGHFKIAAHSRMINLYTYFFELGLNILSPNGVLAFITPQQYLISPNCKGLRDLIRKNFLVLLADFARVRVFEAATYTFVSVIQKSSPRRAAIYVEFSNVDSLSTPSRALEVPNPISEPVNISPFSNVIENIEKASESQLNSLAHIFCASSSSSLELSKAEEIGPRFLTASDIFEWKSRVPSQTVRRSTYGSAAAEKQSGPVVFTSRMTKSIRAVVVDHGEFLGGKVNVVLPHNLDDRYLIAGLLNSKLITFWYREKFSMQHMQGGALPINTTELALVPVVHSGSIAGQVAKLSRELHNLEDPQFSKSRAELDGLVFSLFGLSEEDMGLIESRYSDYGL